MSEYKNGLLDKEMGARVVYRKFVELFENELVELKRKNPNEFAAKVSEWIPPIFYYYDESPDGHKALDIVGDMLTKAHGNLSMSRAVLEGLYNASLRVIKKDLSDETYEYYKYFFEAQHAIYNDLNDQTFFEGFDAPLAIWHYDGSLQSEIAVGQVRKKIKNIADENVESFVYGLLIKALVIEDYPEIVRGFNK